MTKSHEDKKTSSSKKIMSSTHTVPLLNIDSLKAWANSQSLLLEQNRTTVYSDAKKEDKDVFNRLGKLFYRINHYSVSTGEPELSILNGFYQVCKEIQADFNKMKDQELKSILEPIISDTNVKLLALKLQCMIPLSELQSEKTANMIKQLLKEKGTISADSLSGDLADMAMRHGSSDNITVLSYELDPKIKTTVAMNVFEGHGGKDVSTSLGADFLKTFNEGVKAVKMSQPDHSKTDGTKLYDDKSKMKEKSKKGDKVAVDKERKPPGPST